MTASIVGLENELVGLVKEVGAFSSNGFSIYNEEDLRAKSQHQDYPLAGVMFDGAVPADNANAATGTDSGVSKSSVLVDFQFTVIIAIQYAYSGQDDTKQQAYALLDDVRNRVLGYCGVNKRPWRFVLEKPEPQASVDGLVFYYQVWRTSVPKVGSSK